MADQNVNGNQPGFDFGQTKPELTVYISGVNSGPNPASGVGIARSIRLAFPHARIIGVDYSIRSSGIHWPEFDDIWLQRPWSELDLNLHKEQILARLESGAFWISGTDLEGLWLARTIGSHPQLLVPPARAFSRTAKPGIEAHEGLPVKVPAFMSTSNSDWDLDTFCRRNAWKLWLKGPYHDARRVSNYRQLEVERKKLSKTWSTDNLFLQANVWGYEESIALSAHKGELLDCVRMTKRDLTPEGKAWSGHISTVPGSYLEQLRAVILDLEWTGGAELEMVRDVDGNYWMMDWNPRFPAWIYGATLTGINLPGLLMQNVTGLPAIQIDGTSNEFSRVIYEVPVRRNFPLSSPMEPRDLFDKEPTKGAIDMASLVEILDGPGAGTALLSDTISFPPPVIPEVTLADLQAVDISGCPTPNRLFLENTAKSLFQQVIELKRNFASSPVSVDVAYSIKTNPDERMIRLAYESGCLAETISQKEVDRAVSMGFASSNVVLNGPGKWWPPSDSYAPLHAVFCDSIEELRFILSKEIISPGTIFGCRLRPAMVASRFGIPVDDFATFQELVSLLKQIPRESPLGVHIHMASSFIGVDSWWNMIDSVLEWCQAIEQATGRRIECLDLGGGWFPDDWQAALTPRLARIVSAATEVLPELRKVLLEPGKALAQPSMALAVRVLDVRNTPHGGIDVVVDGSIAEMPDMHGYPHRTLTFDKQNQTWQTAGRGKDRVLGRLCMEEDILAGQLDIPHSIQTGDVIVIGDAGAYDRSMSYVFGQG